MLGKIPQLQTAVKPMAPQERAKKQSQAPNRFVNPHLKHTRVIQ